MEWTCPTCSKLIATRLCPTCGEAPVSPHEHTLRGLAERLFQAFTSIDTKTARSVLTLVRRPGDLTVSWMKGTRRVCVAPITLFLLINVLFFAVQSLTGETVFMYASRPFMTHVVFSLHLYAFLHLLFCIALLAASASAWLGFGGLEKSVVDNVLSIFNLICCALYLNLAIGPVYVTTGGRRVLQASLLAISVAAIVIGYLFSLFLITVPTT